ncbi:uncharacterized protein LOC116953996 isoform X4 [Petromyzon marinus]|uniref:Cilia- and flagella-associated protein 36 n=1 Tax=Petromyzon marinus TaxID=7757 RepID=A0AAJ7U5W1_PETMA|nr:uncharacterized protein LOC116953996 isoform X4 [Petromyzon marinus]
MSDWVVDSVVGFLHSPLWADPVMGFIEHRCTVFDPGEENKLSYTDIHREYKELVEGLLESYLQDMGISEQQLLDACSAQSVQSEHLHQVFEAVLAADDFELFKGLMVRKNIELELQALLHLQEQKGVIPECMSVDGLDKVGELDREEMQLLQEAIRASKQQYEMEQQWRRSCILEPGATEEQEDEEPCREGRSLLEGSIDHQVSECCADVPGPSGRRCSDVPDEPPGATGPPQRQAAGASSAPAARQDVPSVPEPVCGRAAEQGGVPEAAAGPPAGGKTRAAGLVAAADQRHLQRPKGAESRQGGRVHGRQLRRPAWPRAAERRRWGRSTERPVGQGRRCRRSAGAGSRGHGETGRTHGGVADAGAEEEGGSQAQGGAAPEEVSQSPSSLRTDARQPRVARATHSGACTAKGVYLA